MVNRNTCRRPGCEREPRGREPGLDLFESRFCSTGCELKYEHVKEDRPARSEPADFGGGESTGVQDL